MRAFRRAPMTALCMFVCAFVYAMTITYTLDGVSYSVAQRTFGGGQSLQWFAIRGSERTAVEPELKGPFDIWDGQWWRIPVSAFHHGGLAHLMCNALSLWTLGLILESRWRSRRFGLFLIPAILLPISVEYAIGHVAIGFSGAICALFGAAIAIREYEEDFPLGPEAITFGLTFLVLCLIATWMDLVQVANAAHFAGLIYGWCAGRLMCAQPARPAWMRTGFVFLHLTLIPLMWYAAHPLLEGRYLWYIADRARTPLDQDKLLRLALRIDPHLSGIWLRLAEVRSMNDDPDGAWTILIEGLNRNPSERRLLEGTRSAWRRIPAGNQRNHAIEELKRVFGTRAEIWLEQIRRVPEALASEQAAATKSPLHPEEQRHFPLDVPIDLKWEPDHRRNPAPREQNPADPDSAREGATL